MKLWMKTICATALALSTLTSVAQAGEWRLDHLEREASIVQRDIAIRYGYIGNGPYGKVFQVHTNHIRVHWDKSTNSDVVSINGIVQQGSSGEWDSDVNLWWNNGDPDIRPQAPRSYQAIPAESLANFSVTPVFKWHRNPTITGTDDPNDNPPATLYYIEHVSLTGSEGVNQHDGVPVAYNPNNPFPGKCFHFKDVKHPYETVPFGAAPSAPLPDAQQSGGGTDGINANYYFNPPKAEDNVASKVIPIPVKNQDEVRGMTRTYSGTITADSYQDNEPDTYGHARLYFGYDAQPCRFSLDVATSEFLRLKDTPRDKESNAFADKVWLNTTGEDAEKPIEPFWDGHSMYSTFLSQELLSTIGNPTYDWETDGSVIPTATDIHSQAYSEQTSGLGYSTPNKDFRHNVQSYVLGQNPPSLKPLPMYEKWPTSTVTHVTITGDNLPKSKLTAKSKINWYQRPYTTYRSETKMEVYDPETGTRTPLTTELDGLPEEQDLDEQIAEIQKAYKDTVTTGAQDVGLALNAEMMVGSWYVPDKFQLVLEGLNIAREVVQCAEIVDKIVEIADRVGEPAYQLLKKTDKWKDEDVILVVTTDVYRETRGGELAKDAEGVDDVERSSEEMGQVAHDEEYFGTACFVAGTKVSTESGLRPIQNLKVGERVWSRSQVDGHIELKRIKHFFKHHTSATLILTTSDGQRIETTKEHPFYVENHGFTPAGLLAIGNSIVTRAGPSVRVSKIEVKKQSQYVFNIEVEDFHTYFVGEDGLWVHNLTCSQHAAKLRRNMNSAGMIASAGDAAHHIVPSGNPQGATARSILSAAGIDIDDAVNGVFIPHVGTISSPGMTVHNGIHTTPYFTEITTELQAAQASVPPGASQSILKAVLTATLANIRERIIRNAFPY